MKAKFAYIATFIVGIIMSYNVNLFQPEEVKAEPTVKTVTLPQIPGKFKLNLDLETGKSIVESNLPVASTDITVNHPTKIVEKVVVKPIIKKEIAYEVKTEIRTIPVMFKLPEPRITTSRVSLPTRVE